MNNALDFTPDTALFKKDWLPLEQAIQKVARFEHEFGEAHLALACHAALASILTPELVNLIRINFLETSVEWIAECDLLLSSLCQPINQGVYEIEPQIRQVLLVALQTHPEYGSGRLEEIAHFLYRYSETDFVNELPLHIKRTYQWISGAYIDPDATIQNMFDLLKNVQAEDFMARMPDYLHIGKTLAMIANPLEMTSLQVELDDLVGTAQLSTLYWTGDKENLLSLLPENTNDLDEITHALTKPVVNWLATSEFMTSDEHAFAPSQRRVHMNKQGRILIVDGQKKWGEELARVLSLQGFSVDAVENVAQALEQLSTILYHIVVLELRFSSGLQGMDLLKELDERGLKEATKVIMHTSFATLEQMRLAFKDYDVADFVPKTSPEAFLKSVQQVFNEKVKINPALDIKWQMRNDVAHLVANLRINGKRVGGNHLLRQRLVEELHDLLCRLFYEAETILVQPLTQGWSGSGGVLVQPFFKGQGRGEDVIVKFGDTKKIKKEYTNFEQYVKRFLSGGRSTVIRDQRYTPHLGGIVYSLLGAGNDQVVDFDDFYRNTHDLAKIVDVLQHLFQETCANWYRNRLQIQLLDLGTEYQQLFDLPKKPERLLTNLPLSIQVKERLSIPSLNGTRTFTNPLSVNVKQSFMCYSSTCIVHGDLNPYNLFIDQSGFTWLIDFQTTERGHILRDFAMLDSAIRFQLLSPAEASLEERLQMEEILCNAKSFSQMEQGADNLPLDNPAVAKAYATIIALRRLAGSFVTQHQHDDISEYYIALFYNALNTLQFSSLEMVQHEHALLCASLLADRLGLGS